MRKLLKIKKGLNINILGKVLFDEPAPIRVDTCSISPEDYPGFIPKPEVAVGDKVIAGEPLFRDKNNPDIKITAPASGTIKAIVRGERRKISGIEIAIDNNSSEQVKHNTVSIKEPSEFIKLLCHSGLWVMMRQRPYDIIPNPTIMPRDIIITAFDSAPLAPDFNKLLKGKENELQAGISALKNLTNGHVYFCVNNECDLPDFSDATLIEIHGQHPAGNPGVQIANISPINKGETVWTLDAITLYRIGALILTGSVPMETIVAITGSEVKNPRYISTVMGADITPLLEDNLNETSHIRIISGNVLTGYNITESRYMRFPYRHITVIPEGDNKNEFMGWASCSLKKMSTSRSFPGHFLYHKLFNPDARLLGGRRAMIMSGEYEKVLPMDIMAEYLIKAIMSRNIERMEELGIYEVAPEDFALCEYVDPSKIELQRIVREGLDYLRKELD